MENNTWDLTEIFSEKEAAVGFILDETELADLPENVFNTVFSAILNDLRIHRSLKAEIDKLPKEIEGTLEKIELPSGEDEDDEIENIINPENDEPDSSDDEGDEDEDEEDGTEDEEEGNEDDADEEEEESQENDEEEENDDSDPLEEIVEEKDPEKVKKKAKNLQKKIKREEEKSEDKYDDFGNVKTAKTGKMNKLLVTGKWSREQICEKLGITAEALNVQLHNLGKKGFSIVESKNNKLKLS